MTRSTPTALLRRGCVIIGRHHHTRNRNTRAVVAGSISIENLNFSHDHHHCWFSSSEVASPSAAEAAATPYILLHHHRDPSLFPYRQPGSFTYLAYHISSAIDAIVTLISSQEARDNFLALTTTVATPTNINTSNSNSDDANTTTNNMSSSSSSSEEQGGLLMAAIINSRILNQSDVGFLKPLTLYNELLHPKLQQSSKFNIHEFMSGCGWALSQFHRTKDELLPKLLTNVNGVKQSSSRGVVEMENENGGENKNDSDDKNDNEELLVKGDDNDGPSSSSRAEEYNFLEVAANDPDSVEGTFVAMTTPEALGAMQLDGIMRLVAGQMVSSNVARTEDQIQIDKLKEHYTTGGDGKLIDDDTKVMNVALLSARVEEIYPPLIKSSSSAEQAILLQKTKSDPNAPLEDESLTPPPEVDESKAQLITQLEVLYELQQSSVNDEGKTKTQTSVMVGKFEGCLFGDPNGDELRWKLASYRPAVEFFNTG
jgi:hypothetical protein